MSGHQYENENEALLPFLSSYPSCFIVRRLTGGRCYRHFLYDLCVSSHLVFLTAIKRPRFVPHPPPPPPPFAAPPHFLSSNLHFSFRCEVENRYQGNPLKGTCYCKLNSNSKFQWRYFGGWGALTSRCEASSLVQVNAEQLHGP